MHTHNPHREAILGVDLGQSQHPTALALLLNIEQTLSRHSWRDGTESTTKHWLLAYAEILPLGTSYTQIAQNIVTKLANLRRLHPNLQIRTVADSTGLGAPVLELIQKEIVHYQSTNRQGVGRLEGILFTGGTAVTTTHHNTLPIDLFHVPKLTLLNSLATAIENNLLQVPVKLPHAATLLAQLQSLEIHHKENAQPQIKINRQGDPASIAHADLVMALAMATWRMTTLYPNGTRPSIHGPGQLPLL